MRRAILIGRLTRDHCLIMIKQTITAAGACLLLAACEARSSTRQAQPKESAAPSSGDAHETPTAYPSASRASATARATRAVSTQDFPPGALPRGTCVESGAKACEAQCAGDDPNACAALALLLANAWGVSTDAPRAVALAQKSCAQKSPLGCGLLASFHGEGIGVPKDPARATQLLQFGCDGNDALSCESLGGQAVDPSFGELDLRRAATYFLKACDPRSFPRLLQGCRDDPGRQTRDVA